MYWKTLFRNRFSKFSLSIIDSIKQMQLRLHFQESSMKDKDLIVAHISVHGCIDVIIQNSIVTS
jgi:hypothetical protein